MDAQLETLRQQNLALLQKLRQGQVNCHQIIDTFQSTQPTETSLGGTSLAGSTGPNYSSQEISPAAQDIDILTGSEAGHATRARESLRSKHRPLMQGTESINAHVDMSNINLEEEVSDLPGTPMSQKSTSRSVFNMDPFEYCRS